MSQVLENRLSGSVHDWPHNVDSGHFRKPIGFSAFSTRTGEFTYIIPEVGLKLA